MKNNSVTLIIVVALLINLVGVGLSPLPVSAAPMPERDLASIDALPAWFASSEAELAVAPKSTGAEIYTYTDDAGRYRFEGLSKGTHKVTLDLSTLPSNLRPAGGEESPVLWLTPGMELTSDPLSTGVRFTAAYGRESGAITGLVFVDQDGDGQPSPGESGIPGVRVIDPGLHQYFVPFDDNDLWTLFQDKAACHNANHLPCGPLHSHVHLTASSDGTAYYYDHWEDGYDADPLNPGPTTETGMLDAGLTRLFQSDIDPAQVGGGPPYYYDGRDRITIFGEPASVVRMAHPDSYSTGGSCPGNSGSSGWLAGAWEVAEVADWGTEYVATVGEDLDYSGGTPDDHDYTALEVMAWQPGTEVYYNGILVATLDVGEVYFARGADDGPGGLGVDSDDTITASAPIQVQMVTGACSSDIVSAHGYTLQPLNVWDNAYWAPVPGFLQSCNPDGRNADTDIYLHNPHSYTITVTVFSGINTADVVVPANSTISVLMATSWPDLATGNQGTHLSSSDTFWGVAVVDSSTNGATAADDYDWGYSLIPESELSSQAVIGYAPGRPTPPFDNGNLVFVTAVADTIIYVDLDQDGLPDLFDMNGDGDADDNNVFGEAAWDETLSDQGIPLQAGQVLRVGDPNDYDLMGALIYTTNLGERIAVAWGQDPCRADYLHYLDMGYTILPMPVPTLFKTDGLAIDADSSGDFSPGDTITYTLILHNNGMGSMNDVVLTDTLPYTYTDFVVGSLQVTTPPPTNAIEYYDGTSWGPLPIADAQAFRVTWPTIESRRTVTITCLLLLHSAIPADITEIINQAVLDSANTDPTDSEVTTPVAPPSPGLEIVKTVTPGRVVRRMPFTYSVRINNTGLLTFTALRLADTLPPDLHYIRGTGVPADPDTIAEPLLVWDDLVPLVGPLPPGESITVTYAVTATPATTGTYVNAVTVTATTPDGVLTDTDNVPIVVDDPAVEINKEIASLDDDDVMPNYVTFTIAITNVGPSVIDVLPLLDHYDPYFLSFVDATPSYPEEDADDGLLTWNDLTGPAPHGFGRNLAPGESFLVTTIFLVTHDIEITTTNTATVTGAIDIYDNLANEDDDAEDVGGEGGQGIPTPVEVLYFRAVVEESAVRLEWATAAELGTLGFHVYRAPSANFDDAQAIGYVPATGPDSAYTHVDRGVTSGQTYWYWLVEEASVGDPDTYGPVQGGVGIDSLPYRLYLPLVLSSVEGLALSPSTLLGINSAKGAIFRSNSQRGTPD